MEFKKFKAYAKYVFFLILVISLAGTASAATGHIGGIALSWDDVGSIDPCYENREMFQQYNAICTINVNTLNQSEQGTKDNLSALHDAGWEIAAHGQNHEYSVAFLKNYTSTVWLNQEIFPNIVEITGYGSPVYSFAYPYSERDNNTDALLAPYFRTLRSTEFDVMDGLGVNESEAYYKWDDTQVLYGVEIDDNSNASLETIESGIDYAMANEYVLVLYGHAITSGTPEDYQTSTSKLESILNYTSRKGGKFYLMGELGNSSWVRPGRFSNVAANFTVFADTVAAGENVTFVDYSVNQTSELLDFGDGSNSNTATAVHKYTTIGTYNATLTVENDVSNQSITKTITVLQPTAPGANFTSNVTNGFAPLSVAFTDMSTGLPAPTSWSWDFGDGVTSSEQSPTHVYSAAGTYTVNLTATNAYGTTPKTAVITVVESSSSGGSSHHSSSSGGGGGGGSPEPARNVEVKELSQVFIANDKAIQFDFTKNATCVVYVGFDSKKTAGKITTIAEQLKNKSTLVSGMPEGEVYKYFNVWVGNSGYATEKNIENPVLCFKVAKSWIRDKKIDPNSITLNRYNDKTWEQFPASLSGEDDEYLYFKSSVSGYSFFAITGKASNEEDGNQAGDAATPGTQEQGNTGSEAEPTSEGNSPGMPGFETIYCIIGLLGVFLYRRR
jgi:PGF-pre-PGF domain-containing protein